MKLLKKVALVAAMSSITSFAMAMEPIADTDLSQVSGQDGVSIAANLNISVGSFVYTDTDAAGGSVSFNNIKLTGAIAATLDVINNATFQTEAAAGAVVGGVFVPNANSVLGVTGGTGLAAFNPTGDVVKIALPQITTTKNLAMSVDSITMGNSTASFGSFAMNNIKLAGTTVYIWAH